MKDRKLIQLLQLISPEAVDKLSKFLASPYFNSSQKVTQLGEYFLSFYPNFEGEGLSEEKAFKSMYPDKTFSTHELNRYTSKLFKLTEQFVEFEGLEHFPYIHGQLRSEYYYHIKADSHFEKSQKEYERFLKKQESPSSAIFFYTYLNKKLSYNFWVQRKDNAKTDNIFNEAFEGLNAYYLTEMLQASATMRWRQKESPSSALMPLLEPAMEFLREHVETMPPIVQIWFYTNEILAQSSDKDYYQRLEDTLLSNFSIVPELDARNLIGFLKARLAKQPNVTRKEHMEGYFNLTLVEIQQGWIYAGNTIYDGLLNNIITAALALKKTDWARNFLEDSKPYMIPSTKENTFRYNLARIEFEEGKIQESLKHLAAVSYADETMALRVKRLELKAYFEVRDLDAFEATLNAFRVYSHRLGKKNPALKELQNLFSNIASALHRIHFNIKQNETKESLQAMIDNNPSLPELDWLQVQIDSL
ncbi:MAG: hypothetical protein AB8F95_07725 [Bacteroidia bacterium]